MLSQRPGHEKARKLIRKSGFIEHQVDKTEPHLENQKIMIKGLKISSKFLNIQKIWEDKTSFEK
jgi:hypothetical protein